MSRLEEEVRRLQAIRDRERLQRETQQRLAQSAREVEQRRKSEEQRAVNEQLKKDANGALACLQRVGAEGLLSEFRRLAWDGLGNIHSWKDEKKGNAGVSLTYEYPNVEKFIDVAPVTRRALTYNGNGSETVVRPGKSHWEETTGGIRFCITHDNTSVYHCNHRTRCVRHGDWTGGGQSGEIKVGSESHDSKLENGIITILSGQIDREMTIKTSKDDEVRRHGPFAEKWMHYLSPPRSAEAQGRERLETYKTGRLWN